MKFYIKNKKNKFHYNEKFAMKISQMIEIDVFKQKAVLKRNNYKKSRKKRSFFVLFNKKRDYLI